MSDPHLKVQFRNDCYGYWTSRIPELLNDALCVPDAELRTAVLERFSLSFLEFTDNRDKKDRVYSLCLDKIQKGFENGNKASTLALKHLLRRAPLYKRNEWLKILMTAPYMTGDLQTSTLSVFREERIRTAIAISCDESAKARELQQSSKEDFEALSEESRVAVFSLSRYAQGPQTVVKVLNEMFKEKPTEIPVENLGNFALRWAQAHQHLTLPKEETALIKAIFTEIVASMALSHQPATIVTTLQKVADTIASPVQFPHIPPGTQSAQEALERAISSEKNSSTFTETVVSFSQDFFNVAAAEFRSTSPAAIATTPNPGEAFPLGPYFNKVAAYVANSILGQESRTTIKRALQFWIAVARTSFEKGDMLTTQAILAGLGNASISPQTSFIGKDATGKLEQLNDIFHPANAYKNYREVASKRLHAGCSIIPFIAVYCADAAFTIDGNRDPYESESLKPAAIQLLGTIIHNIDRCQRSLPDIKNQQTTLVQELCHQKLPGKEAYIRSKTIRSRGELQTLSQLQPHQKLSMDRHRKLSIQSRDMTSVLKAKVGAETSIGENSLKSAKEILTRFQREVSSLPKEQVAALKKDFDALAETQWMRDVCTTSTTTSTSGQQEVVNVFNQVASLFKDRLEEK